MRSITSIPCIFNAIYTYANEIQTIQVEEDRQGKLMTNCTFGNWEGEISIEFVATLTQSLTNFHKTERRIKAAEKGKERVDMEHVK